VPEGFYSINHYNVYSKYYLSLGINYPNASDIILSKSTCKGGLIYIHGECVSVGCIAMGDKYIEEIYTLARIAHNNRKTVQVHIFPFNFNQTPLFVTNYYQSREMNS
jgi:murein L,D-transpeptidase YafK